MTTTKQNNQLAALAKALACARHRRGAISALYRNGPPTQARPKKVLKRNRNPAAVSWQGRESVLWSPAMTAKQLDMPTVVHRKARRRPRPSMSNTDRSEHRAYSKPPIAAMRCDMPASRLNDSCKILLAYVETKLIPEICCAACMKTPMATRWNVLVFPMSSNSRYENGARSA